MDLDIIYISQGNISSKWAHTFQAMKMGEALWSEVNELTLVTSRNISPSKVNNINLSEWYGNSINFSIVRIPTYLHIKNEFIP